MYERVLVVLRALFVQSQIEQVSLRRSIGCGDSFLGDSFFFFLPYFKDSVGLICNFSQDS